MDIDALDLKVPLLVVFALEYQREPRQFPP
jgi:hypothetical protein